VKGVFGTQKRLVNENQRVLNIEAAGLYKQDYNKQQIKSAGLKDYEEKICFCPVNFYIL